MTYQADFEKNYKAAFNKRIKHAETCEICKDELEAGKAIIEEYLKLGDTRVIPSELTGRLNGGIGCRKR